MWFHSLLASWKSARSRGRRPQPRPARRGSGLTLEHLEDRMLPSSYSAASVSALIADINAANAAGGANTIALAAKTTSPYVLTAVNNSAAYGSLNGLPVIAANDNLTIVGNGDTIERSTAAPDFRLLDVASGGSLTLENLTLQGGVCWNSGTYAGIGPVFGGGAIYNDGALVLNGVTVQKNYAESATWGGAGGGIYSVGGSVTLEGGTIVSFNWAMTVGYFPGPESAGWGGGLYAQNSAVTVTNSTLDNNHAGAQLQGYGGGLYALNGTVTVTNSTLDNNTVLAASNGPGPAGGGLYAFGSTVAVTNSTLDGNVAEYSSISVGGYGGGLYVGSGTVILSNDTVKSNSAGSGGGMYLGSGYSVTATLSSDTIESNTAGLGGGLFLGGGTMTLTNDTVESNTAGLRGNGGGIYINWNTTVYLDSFTVANTINNTDSSGLNGPTANIDGTYILQNS
jgi:fibronectin-binding autotransporter adhesin